MMKHHVLFFLILLSVISCRHNPPEGVLPESDYEKIFIELRILSEYKMVTSDSIRARKLTDSIFKHYQIDAEQFKRSHEWYESDPRAHAKRLSRLADSLSILDTRISTPIE
jgi:hypothetical protein